MWACPDTQFSNFLKNMVFSRLWISWLKRTTAYLTLSHQKQSIIYLYDESQSDIEDSSSLQKSFPIWPNFLVENYVELNSGYFKISQVLLNLEVSTIHCLTVDGWLSNCQTVRQYTVGSIFTVKLSQTISDCFSSFRLVIWMVKQRVDSWRTRHQCWRADDNRTAL